jgi:RNA polymerase sigma factor (sigma-70 family)
MRFAPPRENKPPGNTGKGSASHFGCATRCREVTASMPSSPPRVHDRQELLSDANLRRSLRDLIRRRAPSSEVEDIVQATLADALASERAPDDGDELRRWVFAIARNKIADHHRRAGREEPQELSDVEAASAPHSARDLMRWAENALPEGEKAKETLDWMLREGHGEKLEAIAAEARVPAPQVRKRVSRLRQHLRQRWALDLAVALVAITLAAGIWYSQHRFSPVPIAREAPSAFVPQVSRLDRAKELRRQAFEQCENRSWQDCLDRLDQAADLDREGDADGRVGDARRQASDGLRPPPAPPTPSSKPAPLRSPRPSPTTAPQAPKPRPRTTFGSSIESSLPPAAAGSSSK